ncbi:hypothetical protein GJ698_12345 [Pseudoduganella sp. FT26W]|uniref:Uncharacterized protein n=1 Tax=Duganella aquatilis TaxID=2666082 RepID=A0A844D841_9BURK|nr:hypothetical protein [Duganella aquatilis]MRW84872.1 hypothetical protein [Duganella aquatilis]
MSQAKANMQQQPFIASRWERNSADDFMIWVKNSGVGRVRTSTLGQAVSQLWLDYAESASKSELAEKLPDVLRSCDSLSFQQPSEAIAYAGLHLVDRYGRIMQVLEYLLRVGRLPIRKTRVSILEVGSGPAPALYATRDFYAMLHEWPARGEVEVANVKVADSLERGDAWDRTLHYLSEYLMLARQETNPMALPFQRAIHDLSGFKVKTRHNEAVAERAHWIRHEFDSADEYISSAAAFKIAYEEGVHAPSAYDMIFMCNFLTQTEMAERFETELLDLANSLTPGGVLVVMGGVGASYPEIYEKVRNIARSAKLTDVSPTEVFDPNKSPQLDIVRDHVLANVAAALGDCDRNTRDYIQKKLPKDIVEPAVEFILPKYRALLFVNQKQRK